MTTRRSLPTRLSAACALLVLVLLAAVTPGCQFLQNEFFYLCPTPGAQQDTNELSEQQHQ